MTESLSENYTISDLVLWTLIGSASKLLIQLKSLCSIWRLIVSDRYFIKKQLDFANDVHNRHNLRRYITTSEATMIQFQSTTLEGEEPRNEYTRPKKTFSPNVEILGSCNGLILLGENRRTYYLWNPSTRLYTAFSGPYITRGDYRNIALGYDSRTSSYKAVRIDRAASYKKELSKMGGKDYLLSMNDSNNYDKTTVQVYNCRTRSWNKRQYVPYVNFEDARGVTMNGFPHWVMFRNRIVMDLVIVYFDLSEEIFKEIDIPHWLVPSSKFEFGVFQGCLCFIHYTKPNDQVWVMQKHGESWVDLSSEVAVTRVRFPGWSSGHIGVETGNFNQKAFSGAMYVESLVSPLGGEDMVG